VLIVALFAAAILGYAVLSRTFELRSVTPQIVCVAAGLVASVVVTEIPANRPTAEGFRLIGEIALVLCLFTDASRIDIRSVRGTADLPLRLLLLGLPLTIALGVVVGLVILPGLGLVAAFLLAVLLAPTDAGLGQEVVTARSIPVRIRQAINIESGLNDGFVTPLVLFAVAIEEAEIHDTDGGWIRFAVSEIGWGIAVGVVLGVVGARLVRWAVTTHRLSGSFAWVVAPTLAVLAWTLTPMIGGNAFIAAFAAGMAATAAGGRLPDTFTRFGETAGEAAGLAVFFLFGMLVPQIGGYSLPIVVYALLSLTVIRMVPVALALRGTGLSRRTVGFIGWFGPRGLASIVLALLALGDGRNASLQPIVASAVAATVLFSVVAHGLSSVPLVRRYGRFVTTLPASAPEFADTPDLATRRHAGQDPSEVSVG
jgi:NhaP-type Na+/H+ or K+/H+ antiporter